MKVTLVLNTAMSATMISRPVRKSTSSGLVLRNVEGKGIGVFATKTFQIHETVLEFVGDLVSATNVEDLTHFLQVGPNTLLSPSGGIDDFVNHSCAPNTGIQDRAGQIFLFALQEIKAGDEISFDYSTTQMGGFWFMDCICGKAGCRGRIGDFKDLPVDLKQFYIDKNAVLPFVIADESRWRFRASD
jgi:hypothetical protein